MKDTGFSVPTAKLDLLPNSYMVNDQTGRLELYDEAGWPVEPSARFPSAGGGLVSTVDDYLAFAQMMLHYGKHEDGRASSPGRLSRS